MDNKIDMFFSDMLNRIKATPKDKEGLEGLKESLTNQLEDIEKSIEENKEMNDVYKENKEE